MAEQKIRKKKIVHLKGVSAKVHIGTRRAEVSVSIPIDKLRWALGKRP